MKTQTLNIFDLPMTLSEIVSEILTQNPSHSRLKMLDLEFLKSIDTYGHQVDIA
jgi:hypothetical protein